MPKIVLKVLECEKPHRGNYDNRVRLQISIDSESSYTLSFGRMSFRERKEIIASYKFVDDISIKLKFRRRGTQIGRTLHLWTDYLPTRIDDEEGFHRGSFKFEEKKAKYFIFYEVIPDPQNRTARSFHRAAMGTKISLKRYFGKQARGVLTEEEFQDLYDNKEFKKYNCQETIKIKEILRIHRKQEPKKGNERCLKRWIRLHCNAWGSESVIPIDDLPVGPKPWDLAYKRNYHPVNGENSTIIAGRVVTNKMADSDSLFTHLSRDQTFNIVPVPQFQYLLAYTAKTRGIENIFNVDQDSTIVPVSHNEWESGSFPLDWRPEKGEYVTIIGRHIYDLGHLPMATEIHPPHTTCRKSYLSVVSSEDFEGSNPT
jgi:hypothetical protein